MLIAFLIILAANSASAANLSDDDGPQSMKLDLLPGNPDNRIDLSKQRKIEVAIYGSANLNVIDINPRTLSLEVAAQNLVGKSDKNLCRQQDLDEDGHMDLVCTIKTIGYRVQPGEIKVTINAGTYQRQSLRAEAVLNYQQD